MPIDIFKEMTHEDQGHKKIKEAHADVWHFLCKYPLKGFTKEELCENVDLKGVSIDDVIKNCLFRSRIKNGIIYYYVG